MRQNELFPTQNTLPFGARNTPFKKKVQGGFEWSKSINHTLMTNINSTFSTYVQLFFLAEEICHFGMPEYVCSSIIQNNLILNSIHVFYLANK